MIYRVAGGGYTNITPLSPQVSSLKALISKSFLNKGETMKPISKSYMIKKIK